MRQWQHVIPSGAIAALGLWVCYVSFTQQPAQAFLFPRLILQLWVAIGRMAAIATTDDQKAVLAASSL